MKKKNNLLLNGAILAGLFIFLLVRFIIDGFGVMQVVILVITAAMSGFQFWLHFRFFGKNQKKD